MTENPDTKEKKKVRITLPSLKNLEKDGFTKNNIFSYEGYGAMLANLFLETEGLNVALLDDDWGMGKTTFVKQWIGLMNNDIEYECSVIYIDAFAKDFYPDPFMMLVAGINAAFPHKEDAPASYTEKKDKFFKCTQKIISALSKINLGVNLGGVSANVKIEEIMGMLFNDAKDEKNDTEKFECSLKELVKTQKGPLIIVIDELDRCRPDFALRLLERIKHYYAVDGISFLLIANMKQLSAMVKHAYGFGDDGARVYLEKFYDIHLRLPDETKEIPAREGNYKTRVTKYVKYLSEKMGIGGSYAEGLSLQRVQLVRLMEEKKFSLRNVEKIATHVALIIAGRIDRGNGVLAFLITGLLVIRVECPSLYGDILRMHEDMPTDNVYKLSKKVETALLLDRFGPHSPTGIGDTFFKSCWLYVLGRDIIENEGVSEKAKREFKDEDGSEDVKQKSKDEGVPTNVRRAFNDEFYYGLGIHGNYRGMELKILPSLARKIDGLLGM